MMLPYLFLKNIYLSLRHIKPTPTEVKFANIILPIAIPQTLTYGIPFELQDFISLGMRVEVPFGSNKRVSGIVYELHNDKPEAYQVKPIIGLIDSDPILTIEALEFWKWTAQYYCCTLGEVMQAALPAFLKLSTENVLSWIGELDSVPENLDDDSYALAEFILSKKEVKISEIQELKFYGKISQALDTLLSREIIEIKETTDSGYKPKVEKFVTLAAQNDAELMQAFELVKKAPKLEATLLKIIQIKNELHKFNTKQLKDKYAFKSEQLKTLQAKGIVHIIEKEVDRIQLNSQLFNTKTTNLSAAQKDAKREIQTFWDSDKDVVLLKGVTGSGKTMIYIELIKEAIGRGEQVLMMLPEIALTQHIISKLEPYFGEELGVYHSKYSNNERVEIWNKVRNQKYKIIVGSRSALWLPFQNLKCIIIDEEHDPSFKQKDPHPRFNARDAAIHYVLKNNGKILLGSATPSFESYHNAQNQKFGYVELSEKFNDAQPSTFDVVKSNATLASLSQIIALPILEKIEQTIQNNQQVIVFQNRRGYAPILFCNDCHQVSKCHQCDVSLTYHKGSNRLHCHYCGQKYQLIHRCTQCGSEKLSIKGFGTEKIEEELTRIFSKYKISRLDFDTTRGKHAHIDVINEFEKGISQILIGTQMVVKGLDFENVGLVVILNADALLYYPDFRVQERAFQLLVQVAGRAGRQHTTGHIMIQTSNPMHPLYTHVTHNDYHLLYKEEMFIRQALLYPPYCRLIQIFIKHVDEQKAADAITILKHKIESKGLNIIINGPSPSIIKRAKNKYIYEMMLKCPLNSKELTHIKSEVLLAVLETKSTKGYSSIQTIIDVDPY